MENRIGVNRRSFLKLVAIAAAGSAGAALYHFRFRKAPAASVQARATKKLGSWEDLYRQRWTWDNVVKGTHGWSNCRSACAWNIYVKGGVVVREEQSAPYAQSEPGVPDFNPRGCQKGACYTDVMYGPSRTTVPLKRVGERGSGQWQRISWEQAIREMAEKCIAAASRWGTDCLYQDLGPNFDFGPTTAGRFKFQQLSGGILADNWGEIGDLNYGGAMTLGFAHCGGGTDEWFLSDYLVVWMMNPSVTQIPDAHFLYEARYNGSELVVIDPMYSPTAIHADQWLPIAVGSDAALGLAVARHLFDSQAIDLPFVREQTDLPLLARLDNGRLLREADLQEGGRDDQLFLWHPTQGKPVPAPGCSGSQVRRLTLDFEAPIEGQWTVKLKDGREVGVVPVGAMLREHLEPWTFAETARVTGLHEDQIRRFAEGFARAKRPMVLSSWGSNRYFHSDLMNRSKILCLALKGAFGRKGTGYQATSFFELSGFANAMQMESSGVTGRMGALFGSISPGEMFSAVVDIVAQRKTEGDLEREGENNYLRNKLCDTDVVNVNLKSPIYRGRLEKEEAGLFPRSLGAYYEEARDKKWSPGLPRHHPPKVYFSGGANLLRRNNLPQYLKASMWDDMELIVDINPKFTFTGTQADYILPAAGWYEKPGVKYTVAHIPYLHYCDVAIPPLAESKDEYEIYWLLTREIEQLAKAANLPAFDGCGRGSTDWKTLHARYSNQGDLGAKDAEVLMHEILRGDTTDGMTLEALKRDGVAKFVSAGKNVGVATLNNPDWKGKGVLNTLTRFTEHKEPWPTYCGRITSFIDHPWFIEMREQFTTHKGSPKAGGDYPFQFVSCHARWSIHSIWRDTPLMLRMQRGEPQVWLNPEDARRLGIKDYDYAKLFNDYGSVRMRIKHSALVRPGVAYYYHAWEPHQFPNHQSYKWLIPGIVNPLHMAGGYGHIDYAMNRYQPGSAVQDTRIGIAAWHGEETGALPVVREGENRS